MNRLKTAPQPRRAATLGRMLRYTKPHVLLLALSLLLSLVYVLAALLAPVFIGRAVDHILGPGSVDFGGVLVNSLLVGVSAGAAALSRYAAAYTLNAVTYRTITGLRNDAYDKLAALPVAYIDSHSHGDIMARIVTDIDLISDGLIQGFSQLFTGILTIAGTLALLIAANWLVAAAVVLFTPLSLFVAYFIARGTHSMFQSQAKDRGDLTALSEEMLGSQLTVKLFGQEAAAQRRFEAINESFKKSSQNAAFYSAMVNPSTRFVNGLIYLTVCILGVLSVIAAGGGFFGLAGALTVGELSSLLLHVNHYTKPFNEITGVVTEFQTALAGGRRVLDLLDEAELTPDRTLPALAVAGGGVELRDMAFSYTPDRPLIEDFTLSVVSGKRVAIVGPTGCGKTTVINLLLRFYETDAGSIEVDGQNIRGVTRLSLRTAYGMVLQDTWLKKGTIYENIAYGKPDATPEEVAEAAAAARIRKFIERQPAGYDTLLDENGGNLSEGQKQLLSIARVMLVRPPMLILDEATSNIDLRTEIRVQKAFKRLMEGKTSFIVAHRLSTIQNADIILVMKDGKIIEKGNHAELLSQKGFYHELYNAQFS